MALVSRDVFARTELHRELKKTTEACYWCGGRRGLGVGRRLAGGKVVSKLYEYHTEGDGGRKSEHAGLFCCRSCFDSYHCL